MRGLVIASALLMTAHSAAAADLPLCSGREVRDKVERAVFADLAKLGLPVVASTRETILAEIGKLSEDDSPYSRNARQGIGRSMGLPADNLLVCAQTKNPTGVRAVVIQNPRRTSQWGVMVLNYGVPNRVAVQDLEFVDQR